MKTDDEHLFVTWICAHCATPVKVPLACGNRFCEVCHAKRRHAFRRKISHCLNQTLLTSEERFRFITLTLPNSADPKAAAKQLIKSFRRLRQRKFWKTRVRAGVSVIEVTGRPGGWHVHLHTLCVARWIPQKMLASQWRKVSPGRIVDIRLVPKGAAIGYLSKYFSKDGCPINHQYLISDALKGFRLFTFYGEWHSQALEVLPAHFECSLCGCTDVLPLDCLFCAKKHSGIAMYFKRKYVIPEALQQIYYLTQSCGCAWDIVCEDVNRPYYWGGEHTI